MPNLAERTLEAAKIAGWELDVGTRAIRWTALAFSILELDPSRQRALDDVLDFFPPQARATIEAAIDAAARTGAAWDLELPSVTARGRDIWVRICGRAIREGGKTTKLFGAFEDVTVRHDLAARLARLSVVARQMTNGVITTDALGRIDWINDAFVRLTGYDIHDLRGRKPGEILQGPATDPATVHQMRRGIASGDGFDVEIVNYTKDRKPYWMAIGCSPLRDAAGTLTGFIAVQSDVSRRRAAEDGARAEAAEREHAEAMLRDVLDTLPNAVTAYDADERFLLANRAYVEMFPITAAFSVPGRRFEEVMRLALAHGQYADAPSSPDGREAWIAEQLGYLRARAPHELRLADGRFMQILEGRSQTGRLVTVRTDTTSLKLAEAQARIEAAERERAETLLRDVLDTVPTAITAYDADERCILYNRAYKEMFPVAARFAEPGRRYEDVVRHAVEQGQYADAGTTPAEQEAWIALQVAHHRDAGGPRTLRVAEGRVVLASNRRSDSGNLVCVRADITDLDRAEQKLRVQAERDPLTLLANRTSFLAALDRALTDVARDNDPGGALFLLDVDYFKQINDTLGHDAGDALLVEIAARLRGLLRGSDMAARLGGDEFGVIMPGLIDDDSLADRMDAIHGALSALVEVAGRHVPIGVTAGVTTFPCDGMDGAKLLKNADLALYEAKRQGRGRWSAFRPEQSAAMEHNIRLADALREALAQNRIAVALQPKRWLRGGGHAGFEALARWHDGTRWVPPAEFIPVAEDTGLTGQLGRAVMEATLAHVRELRTRGLDPGRVAVNATGAQLLDNHFVDETVAALERHGLGPADLELELTETVLFGRAAERVDAVLRKFSELGISLALDDFGTGYASLSHLSRLPIDRLKIDCSFVAGIGGGGPGGVIARSVISLAHSLMMEVIAEGIETTEQVTFLEAAGCDMGQGNLFSKPLLTTDEAADYLRRQAMRRGATGYEAAAATPR